MITIKVISMPVGTNLANRMEALVQERARNGWTLRAAFSESDHVWLTFAKKEKATKRGAAARRSRLVMMKP